MTPSTWADGRVLFTAGILVLIIAFGYYFFFAPQTPSVETQGGLRLELEIAPFVEVPDEDLKVLVHQVKDILEFRIASVTTDYFEINEIAGKRLQIEVICSENSSCEDTRDLPPLILMQGKLEFKKVISIVNPGSTLPGLAEELALDKEGTAYLLESAVLLDGQAIEDATSEVNSNNLASDTTYVVALTFAERGAKDFAELLESDDPTLQAGDRLAIVLDGVIQSAPSIQPSIIAEAERGWQAVRRGTSISGSFTQQESQNLAIALRSGPLPARLNVISQEFKQPKTN